MWPIKKLRESQHDIADAAYENDEQLIVAGMGAGKTAGALTAFSDLQAQGFRRRALVLAPPLVALTVWPAEPGKWEHLQHLTVEALSGSPAQRLKRLKESRADILTLSIYLCKWLKENLKSLPADLDVLIIDEPSFFKGPRSANAKALRRVGRQTWSVVERFKTRIGLTGTPRPNGYEDLWHPMMILTDDGIWPPFDDWRRRNFMPEDPNGYRWTVHDFRAKELDKQMASYVTSVDADLDLDPLSAGSDFDFKVTLPPGARAKYDEMEEDMITAVVASLRKAEKVTEQMVEDYLVAAMTQGVKSGKLAQIAQGYLYDEGEAVTILHEEKVEALRELRLAAGDENLLIWYGYRADLPLIHKALDAKDPLPQLGGTQWTKSKQVKFIDEFGAGKIKNLLAHPASAAHGIDALKMGGRRMIWFCPTFSAEQYAQALMRLHRPGQTKPVFSHQIVAENTVDMVKVNRVAYKQADEASWVKLVAKVRSML